MRFIAEVPLSPGWPAAGTGGLGVEWSATFYQGDLNVNSNGDDALIVTTAFYHQRDGKWITHNTGTVHGDFIPFVDTGGGGVGGGVTMMVVLVAGVGSYLSGEQLGPVQRGPRQRSGRPPR